MQKLTFLIVTSDGYDDLIDGFIHFKNLFARSSNFNFLFALETTKRTGIDNCRFITTYKKIWSERLLLALNSVSDDFLYILPEDFFFMHQTDDKRIESILEYFVLNNLDYISASFDNTFLTKVDEFEGITIYSHQNHFGIKKLHYLNSYGLYRTEFLKKILFSNENIWEFEFNVGYRLKVTAKNFRYQSQSKDPFALYAPGVISRGSITEAAFKFFELHKFKLHWINKKKIPVTKEDFILYRMIKIPPRYLKLLYNTLIHKVSILFDR